MPNPYDQFSPEFIMAAGRRSLFGEPARKGLKPAFGPNDLNGFGPFANEYLPMLMRMTGTEKATMQFSASQNLFERLADVQDAGKMSSIATQATRIDAARVQNWSDNIQKSLSGSNELSPQQMQRSQEAADFFSRYSGYIMKFAGEDKYGALFGNRSGTVLGMRLQRAFNDAKDPMTAAYGYRPSYTAGLADAMMGQMYGSEGSRYAMRGIEATKAGGIVEYLAARGELGRNIATQPIAKQSDAANAMQFDDETVRRMVRRTPEISKVLADEGTPSAELLSKTEAQVRSTLGQLRDPGSGLTKEKLGEMVGGEQIMQELQGKQIKDKMHSLAKSVRTMQEIFGDEGRPDAPMQEIMKAISNFTQGASRSMTDDKVNAILRSARNVAKRSGMTMDELIQASDVAKERIVSRGGHASMGLPVAIHAAQVAQGKRQSGAFEYNAFGDGGIDESMVRATLETANAVTSNYAEQRAIVALLDKQGNTPVKAGSQFEAYKAAAAKGETAYTYNGKTYDLDQTDDEFGAMLMEGAGLTRAEIINIRNDKQGLLEMKSQQEAVDYSYNQQLYGKTKEFRFALAESINASQNIDFAGLGIETDEAAKSALVTATARNIDESLREQANSPEMADVSQRSQLYQKAAVEGLAKALETERGMTPAAAKVEAQKRFQNTRGLSGQITEASAATGAPSATAYFKDTNQDTARETRYQKRMSQLENIEQDAGSMLNEGSVITRAAQVLDKLDANTTLDKALMPLLGVLDEDQLSLFAGLALDKGLVTEFAMAGGTLKDLKQKAQDSEDPEDIAKYRAHVDLIEGLMSGGTIAEKMYKKYENTKYLEPKQLERLQNATRSEKGIHAQAAELGMVASALSPEAIADNEKLANRIARISPTQKGGPGFKAEMDSYLPGLEKDLTKLMKDDKTVEQMGKGGWGTLKEMIGHHDSIKQILTKNNAKLSDLGEKDAFTIGERETITKSLTALATGFKDIGEAAETFSLPGANRNKREPMTLAEQNDRHDFMVNRKRDLQAADTKKTEINKTEEQKRTEETKKTEDSKKTEEKKLTDEKSTAASKQRTEQKLSPYGAIGEATGLASMFKSWANPATATDSSPTKMVLSGSLTLKHGDQALADFEAIQQNAIAT